MNPPVVCGACLTEAYAFEPTITTRDGDVLHFTCVDAMRRVKNGKPGLVRALCDQWARNVTSIDYRRQLAARQYRQDRDRARERRRSA